MRVFHLSWTTKLRQVRSSNRRFLEVPRRSSESAKAFVQFRGPFNPDESHQLMLFLSARVHSKHSITTSSPTYNYNWIISVQTNRLVRNMAGTILYMHTYILFRCSLQSGGAGYVKWNWNRILEIWWNGEGGRRVFDGMQFAYKIDTSSQLRSVVVDIRTVLIPAGNLCSGQWIMIASVPSNARFIMDR